MEILIGFDRLLNGNRSSYRVIVSGFQNRLKTSRNHEGVGIPTLRSQRIGAFFSEVTMVSFSLCQY